MDVDGKHARAANAFAGREPTPSANGDFVISLAGQPSPRLIVADGGGAGARAITDGKLPAPSYAVWSPDRSRIAYATWDFGTRNIQVFVMNADGAGAQLLTAIAPTEGRVARPSWSPDGRTIAFQVRQESPTTARSHIHLVDVATKAVTKLAPHDGAYVDEAPSWFPDGTRIAFQSNRNGTMQIWSMTKAGTEAQQITTWHATPSNR
jgi:TolB protein